MLNHKCHYLVTSLVVERPKRKKLYLYIKGMFQVFGQYYDILSLHGSMMALINFLFIKDVAAYMDTWQRQRVFL